MSRSIIKNWSTHWVDLLSFLVLSSLIVASATAFYLARDYGDGSPSGGNVFPQLACGIACITAAISLANRLWVLFRRSGVAGKLESVSWTPLIVASSTLGFLILLPIIGYPILAPLWMLATLWLFGMRSPWILASVSIGLSAIAWILLSRLAFAPPPAGLIEQFL